MGERGERAVEGFHGGLEIGEGGGGEPDVGLGGIEGGADFVTFLEGGEGCY